MRVPGTNIRENRYRKAEGDRGSFLFFRRMMRYVAMQRRMLVAAIVAIVIMAVGYSANISAMMPVLQVMLTDQSVPRWVNQSVAGKRLGLQLETFSRVENQRLNVPAEFDYAARVMTRPDEKSPLHKQLHRDDLIVALDGQRTTAPDLFRRLSDLPPEQRVELTVLSPETLEQRQVSTAVKHTDLPWRMARYAAGILPDGVTKRDRLATLGYILGVVLALAAVQNVARFVGEYLVSVVAARTLVSVRRQMYRKVLRLPVSFFAQHGTSDVMSRFTQDSQDIYRGLTFVFAQSIREPLKSLGVFCFAMWYAPRVMLFALPVSAGAAFLIRYFGKMVRRANRRLLQGFGHMLAGLEGALIGIRVVKGYNMERFERRHLFGVDFAMLRQQLRIEFADALSSPLFELLGMAVGAAATVWFYNEVLDGRMTQAGFFTMVLCLVAIFDPLRKLSNLYTRLQRANAAAERVFEIIDMPVEEDHVPGGLPAAPCPPTEIKFVDLTFTYPGADRPAVRDFSLTVRRGERVALVGPNGSGKTTLLALLARFFEPQTGRIEFDGVDIAACSLKSLRGQISLVTQDTVIFADTVRNNIAYGDERLLRRIILQVRHPKRKYPAVEGAERIEQAARAAYADEFIRQLPQGYDTAIGEHGATLSGGQKQRIAIARAILRNAPVLIFDEATSQIDADSEQKIHRALEEFLADRTGFIIAHRFSTILQADRIVVMDGGRIVDSGRHAELLERCRLYKTLFETQMVTSDESAR